MDQGLRSELCVLVDEIAARLRDIDAVRLSPGLSSGSAGIGLFFAKYYEAGEHSARIDAHRFLVASKKAVRGSACGNGLYGGSSGVALALLMARSCGVDVDEVFVFEVDTAIESELKSYVGIQWLPYELMRGVVGRGVYGLCRYRQSGLRRALDAALGSLERQHTGLGDAMYHTPQRGISSQRQAMWTDGYRDIGMAHGVAGVVSFDAQLGSCGVPGTGWGVAAADLLSDVGERAGTVEEIPAFDSPQPELRRPAGTGWCYGVLSVATALSKVAASRGTHRSVAARLVNLAVSDTRASSDAGLCHGAMGRALMLSRLTKQDAGVEGSRAAISALAQALAQRTEVAGDTCGFRALEADGQTSVAAQYGVLTGIAGIGMALLTVMGGCGDDWLDMMLI